MIFEDIFRDIGDFGRGQIIQYGLLCLPFMMAGFLSVDVVFLMAVPDFVCVPDNYASLQNSTIIANVTEHLIKLQMSSGDYKNRRCYSWNVSDTFNTSFVKNVINTNNKCKNGFLYSKMVYGSTIPQEYDLVCDLEYVRLYLKTVFFIGRIIGAIVFGQLSDILGRLFTFLIVVFFNIISGLGLYFSTSSVIVGIFLLIQGFAQVGYTLTTFVLGGELVGTSKRKWTGTVIQVFYTTAFILIPFMYYIMQSWRYLALFSGIPSIIFLSYGFLVYESPRWLLAKGQSRKALSILEKIAKTNNVYLSEELKIKILSHNNSEEYRKEIEKKYSILDLVKTKPMLFLSLNVWFNWIVNALVYYGIIFNTENLVGSLYLNFMFMGLMEIPPFIICILLVDRLGRRQLMLFSLWAIGITFVIGSCIPKDYSLLICIVAMVGKLFVSISYGVLYFYTAEVFPTVVRNAAMGMSSMSARLGATLAAPILGLKYFSEPLPMIIFAILAVIAGCFVILIPETNGKPLDHKFNKEERSAIPEDEKPCISEKV